MSLNFYLPKIVVKHLRDLEESEKKFKGTKDALVLQVPEFQVTNAVVLFADLSGFTRMCRDLTELGDKMSKSSKVFENKGTEKLAVELNKYMSKILDFVLGSGGDVLKFAGDAMIAIYACTHDLDKEDEEASIDEKANLCNIAINTALNIQDDPVVSAYTFIPDFYPGANVSATERKLLKGLRDYGVGGNTEGANIKDEVVLKVKLGIGLGRINIVHIGGESDNHVDHRYEYVPIGKALQQAYDAESKCKPGDVVTSRDVWKLVKENFIKNSKNNKAWWNSDDKRPYNRIKLGQKRNTQFYKLLSNSARKRNEAISPSPRVFKHGKRPYESVTDRTLLNYIPNAVIPYLEDTGEGAPSAEKWGNELRRVTTLFIQLGLSKEEQDLIVMEDEKTLNRLQQVFKRVQESTYRFMGTINKFLIDDKGSTVIVVFGMPPFAHDDDIFRGVECSKDLLKSLAEENLKAHIGVSTGVSFCGVVGKELSRREYSVLGDRINLAARLMVHAQKVNANDSITVPSLYICKRTRQSLKKENLRIAFSPELAELKGYERPQLVFRYEYKQVPLRVKVAQSQKTNFLFAMVHLRISKDESSSRGTRKERKGRKAPAILTTRTIIQYSEDDTCRDLKAKAAEKAGLKGKGLNTELYWVREDPITAIVPPVLVNDNERLMDLHNFDPDEILQFQLKENKEWAKKGMQQPPLIVTSDGINMWKPIIPPTSIQVYSNQHDSYSICSVLEKLRKSPNETIHRTTRRRHRAPKHALQVLVLEGSYGVGRSYAIEHVFGRQRTSVKKNLNVARAHGSRFQQKGEEVCDIWKPLLGQLLESVCGEEFEKQPRETIFAMFKKGLHLFNKNARTAAGSGSSHSHVPSLDSIKDFLITFISSNMEQWSEPKAKCKKCDMDNIFGKDKSLNAFVQAGNSGIAGIMMQASLWFNSDSSSPNSTSASEKIVHMLCAIFAGLATHSDKPVLITIDHTEYLDPFSWLVLVELAEWWKFVPLTIVLSVRSTFTSQSEGKGSFTKKNNSIVSAASFNDAVTDEIIKHFHENVDTMTDSSTRIRRMETQGSNFSAIPFTRQSTKGKFMTMKMTERETIKKKKVLIPKKKKQEKSNRVDETLEQYSYLDRIADRQILLMKLRELNSTRFIDVEANVDNTKYIVANILEVKPSKIYPPLVELLHEKAGGMPLIIHDALVYYHQTKMLDVLLVHGSDHELSVDESAFEKYQLKVPPAVEAICAMINDNLSIAGVVALKIAAIISGSFTLGMIKAVFQAEEISTDAMCKDLDDEWEYIRKSRTILPESGQRQYKDNEKDNIEYNFGFGWIRDSIVKRMTTKQRNLIESVIKEKGLK